MPTACLSKDAEMGYCLCTIAMKILSMREKRTMLIVSGRDGHFSGMERPFLDIGHGWGCSFFFATSSCSEAFSLRFETLAHV